MGNEGHMQSFPTSHLLMVSDPGADSIVQRSL